MVDTELLNLLNTDIATCSQLLEILEQEFAALNERHLEELQQLLADKQPLLESLNRHATQRSQILVRQGQQANAAGFNNLASQSPHAQQLLASHTQLYQLMEQCQAANLRNGRLIRTSQVNVGNALNIIRGHDGPSLYDRSGTTASQGTHRSFTRA